MTHPLVRAAAAAALGALAGAVCLMLAYADRSELTLDMDRELPRRTAAGVYAPERAGDRTFAWTSQQAEFRLRGLDRRAPWVCAVDVRGGRSESIPQPQVEIAIDGVVLARQPATNEYQRVEVTAPARPNQPGFSLTIAASETVVPGPGDPRQLGVQLDRVVCRPVAGMARPPRSVLESAAIAGAALGAALGLCLSAGAAAAGVLLIAAGQSVPLAAGIAPYATFSETAVRLAIWIAALMVVAVKLLDLRKGQPLPGAARFVVLFSMGVFYLKLLGLLHPSKLIIDALFHAHRFQAVLAGDYYFTQVMPSGVTFPYAIGLYLVATPWAALTRDHVTLLRIVVCAAECLAGALLYPMIVRAWVDRLAGALAVVLFHTVALPYVLIGNANMTNAFGQAMALITLVVAATWSFRVNRIPALAGLFAIASLAFLSHISTAAVLGATLITLTVLYRGLGIDTVKPSALPVLVVTIVAATFAWGVYYGRFTEVYATALERVRPSASPQPPAPESSESVIAPRELPSNRVETTFVARTGAALRLTIESIGWPIVILAAAGVWRLWKGGIRDRVGLLLAAWGVAYLVFLGVGIVPRVEGPFQRYAAEFVGRVVFATYPAAVILAGCGAAWGWRRSVGARIAALVCIGWAVADGVYYWRNWFG